MYKFVYWLVVIFFYVRRSIREYKDELIFREIEYLLLGNVFVFEVSKLGIKFFSRCDVFDKKDRIDELVCDIKNGIGYYFMYEFGMIVY